MGCKLFLDDENNWWITGDKDSARFIEKMSVMMNLEKCTWDSSPRIIFLSNRDIYDAELLRQGWEFQDYRSAYIWYHKNFADIICETKNDEVVYYLPDDYWNICFSLWSVYRKIINNGGMPFHSALIEIGGQGILISAPSNTGKSTCCRRIPSPWKPLCDDEVLIVLDKQQKYFAYPFPTWSSYISNPSDKSYNVQHSVPISAIFFIKQSKIDKVTPLNKNQAAVFMYGSSAETMRRYWVLSNREDLIKGQRLKIFNNSVEMSKCIPAFQLEASLDGRFWEEIGKAINLNF